VREAYRINALIPLGNGRSVADVADALLIDPDTVPSYFKRNKNGGLDALLRMNHLGSDALLDDSQMEELRGQLRTHLYPMAESARSSRVMSASPRP